MIYISNFDLPLVLKHDLDIDQVLAGSFEQTRHNNLERVSVTKPSLALVVETPPAAADPSQVTVPGIRDPRSEGNGGAAVRPRPGSPWTKTPRSPPRPAAGAGDSVTHSGWKDSSKEAAERPALGLLGAEQRSVSIPGILDVPQPKNIFQQKNSRFGLTFWWIGGLWLREEWRAARRGWTWTPSLSRGTTSSASGNTGTSCCSGAVRSNKSIFWTMNTLLKFEPFAFSVLFSMQI